jgi:hypothetical protein
MRLIGSIFSFIIGLGILVALLRAFNWDPVALGTWGVDKGFEIINKISDWFSGNPAFQKFVSK